LGLYYNKKFNNLNLHFDLVLDFVSTVMCAPSAAVSDARSEAAGDAGTSSRQSDNADEAAPPAPEGLVRPAESIAPLNIKIENAADLRYLEPPADITVITESST
jgi:hypothetical protein